MTNSEFPAIDLNSVPAAPESSATILEWKECFRPQDIPPPKGYEDIDTLIAARERSPAQRAALEAARVRLAKKLANKQPKLATLRMERGWSQKRLAEAIGTSQPHIARIESGRDVMLSTANDIARALGVTLTEVNLALGFGDRSP